MGVERLSAAARVAKAIPGVRGFLRSRRGLAFRHWVAVRLDEREDFKFTQFLRLPTQFDALAGPVLDHLDARRPGARVRVVVVGCSRGAEPFTIASVLLARAPGLEFSIEGYDIAQDLLDKAALGVYTEDEVRGNALIHAGFVAQTFLPCVGGYAVQPAVAERVSFARADVLDPRLPERIGTADIVYAQNIMLLMERPTARRAFDNVAALLKPRAALFVDGMDLDMRARLTRRHGLAPLDFQLARIHDEARVVRGERWPYSYTGLEPFDPARSDRLERYATVFLKG